MGNCYIFNPANGLLKVTLNSVYLGTIYPADSSVGYQPQSIVTLTARHDDGTGYLAIADPNILSVFYPDDPKQQFGPYTVNLCLAGRGVSVDDDIIIYAGRPLSKGAPSVATMTARGFVLNTTCTSATMLSKTAAEKTRHKPGR
ncbi:hypothetical protein SAMN05444161_7154 [Rhizobiales bacterium GAS191]|jgi:hypothetical protein|nr:hypothetical protein SAMN05519103_06502 [Rhizobiales bacterium GAS113]SED76363.1 hypothetical protein SAMN05519104_4300 [Rhizobiales bacterium GAS188]SEE78692.1 hypothetical protein SAMN05444161_7154 [Rhizobiales bacterium GAS191]